MLEDNRQNDRHRETAEAVILEDLAPEMIPIIERPLVIGHMFNAWTHQVATSIVEEIRGEEYYDATENAEYIAMKADDLLEDNCMAWFSGRELRVFFCEGESEELFNSLRYALSIMANNIDGPSFEVILNDEVKGTLEKTDDENFFEFHQTGARSIHSVRYYFD